MFNDFNYMSKKLAESDSDSDLMDIDIDNTDESIDIDENDDDDIDEVNNKNKIISTSKEKSIKDNKKIKNYNKLSDGKNIKNASLNEPWKKMFCSPNKWSIFY